MKYLYIDTSSSYLYTGIVENDNLICEVKEEFGQSLSEVTMPKIESMFSDNKLVPNDIDKIIVVNGPGSFTGIRVGITIAKVFAWGLNIPITTITSLEAMAISSNSKITHVPLINARRGYVYAAVYDEYDNEIFKPSYIKLDELLEFLTKIEKFEFVSNDIFTNLENVIEYSPNILNIVEKFKDKDSINPHSVNPDYLKLTEAEESKL